MRLLKKPTAVYLASFRKLCQRQKACFHRFFAVFTGFYTIFLDFSPFRLFEEGGETLGRRGLQAFPFGMLGSLFPHGRHVYISLKIYCFFFSTSPTKGRFRKSTTEAERRKRITISFQKPSSRAASAGRRASRPHCCCRIRSIPGW